MEVSLKGGNLVLKHKLKKNETYKISKSSKFETLSIYKKPQIVSGFSNCCEDHKAILIIDYDNVDYSIVEEDYKLIQGLYKLPQAYVFQTKTNNYHLICLKKFLQSQIFRILLHTRCDNNFKDMLMRSPFRSYILRLSSKKGSKKPKFIGMVGKTNYIKYQISSAHLNLLKRLYPKIKHPKYQNPDNLRQIKLQMYET